MKFGMIIGDSLANTHTEFHYNRFSRSEDTNDSFWVGLVHEKVVIQSNTGRLAEAREKS